MSKILRVNMTNLTAKLEDVAVRSKPMPDEFIDDSGMFVTEDFIKYLKPLVGPMPEMARLSYPKVLL